MGYNLRIPDDLAIGHSGPIPDGKTAGEAAVALGCTIVNRFRNLYELSVDDAILDIGCGPGRMAIAILEEIGQVRRYLGFDIQRRYIEFCNESLCLHGYSFRHLDAYHPFYNSRGRMKSAEVKFPAEDGTFSFAFAASVFTHMFTEEVIRYLHEAQRCLEPGGRLLATLFLLDEPAKAAMKRGAARFNFNHAHDREAWISNRDNPAKAVAYDVSFIRTCLVEAGFVNFRWVRGEWSRYVSPEPSVVRTSQDMIVVEKTS